MDFNTLEALDPSRKCNANVDSFDGCSVVPSKTDSWFDKEAGIYNLESEGFDKPQMIILQAHSRRTAANSSELE